MFRLSAHGQTRELVFEKKSTSSCSFDDGGEVYEAMSLILAAGRVRSKKYTRARKYVSKSLLAFREKKQIAFPPSFWCVCDRGKQNPAGDAFELEKGNGDVRNYNTCTAAAVVLLYDTSTRCMYLVLQSRASLSRCSIYLVPGTVHASAQQTIPIRGTGVCLTRRNSSCVGRTHSIVRLQT